MKLRNKKTGEIRDTEKWVFSVTDRSVLFGDTVYNSFAGLCEEWEDYEESKEFIFIDDMGSCQTITENEVTEMVLNCMKEIGNYFETKEEAEKAVEELKALKRLKDYTAKRKGHLFDGWFVGSNTGLVEIYTTLSASLDFNGQVRKDIHTIFGGLE